MIRSRSDTRIWKFLRGWRHFASSTSFTQREDLYQGAKWKGQFLPHYRTPDIPRTGVHHGGLDESVLKTSKHSDAAPQGDHCRLALIVRNDLKMGKGKIASQCAHAAVQVALRGKRNYCPRFESWLNHGESKVVLRVEGENAFDRLKKTAADAGVPSLVVHDAGRTQIAARTATVLALGPTSEASITQLTNGLKLL